MIHFGKQYYFLRIMFRNKMKFNETVNTASGEKI